MKLGPLSPPNPSLDGARIDRDAIDRFVLCVFLDTNIVLEGRPLAEAPWDDFSEDGLVLALVTPTVLSEIDAKKRDGRLGTIAREFNRLVSRAIASRAPVQIADPKHRIYLDVAKCRAVRWEEFGYLDREDADSRIIAEILHADGIVPAKRRMLSHDLKPLWLAQQHGIEAIRASDLWLRPKEPSPSDKEIQRLKQRLSELEQTEPRLNASVRFASVPDEAVKVAPLSEAERSTLRQAVLKRGERPRHDKLLGPALTPFMDDQEYVSDESYKTFVEDTLPKYLDLFPRLLEETYGQIAFELTVRNEGPVRAEHLIARVELSSGWISEKIVLYPLAGPTPKKTARYNIVRALTPPVSSGFRHVGRHEMDLAIKPERNLEMEVHCEDFPQYQEWTFQGFVFLDPAEAANLEATVRLTAANLHGQVVEVAHLSRPVREARCTELFDLIKGRQLAPVPLLARIDGALERGAFDELHFVEIDKY